MPQERKQSPKLPGTPVMQTTPVPRNPADRCRNRNQTSETARHARPAHSAAADSLADRCRLRNHTSETARHARPAHDSRRRALESFKACKTPKASKRAQPVQLPMGVVVLMPFFAHRAGARLFRATHEHRWHERWCRKAPKAPKARIGSYANILVDVYTCSCIRV